MHKLRNCLLTARLNLTLLNFKSAKDARIGLIRGYMSGMLGRVLYKDHTRPLLLGKNVDFYMEPGSAIVLTGKNEISIGADPSNLHYPTASSIGTKPRWDFMNPVTSQLTRVRLKKNAQLIMEPNTAILIGSYIAVWADQKLRIGENTCIAHSVFINTRCGLTIGRNVMIAHGTSIMDYDGHPVFYKPLSDDTPQVDETYGGTAKPIVIEDNVWIGFNATILKGCTIGSGAIVGAGAMVVTDVPPNSIVLGNPARVIQRGISWRKY